MSQKWNLQDIRPADSRPRTRPTARPSAERPTARPQIDRPTPDTEAEEVTSIPVIDGNKKSRKQLFVATIIAIAVLGGGFTISALTGGAEITVYPKVRELTVNAEFTTYPDNRPGELSYELLTLEATGERQVTATGQENVEKLTRGELLVQKTTPGSERLIKNTRFRSPDGLIYRIEESVDVPGAGTTADGSTRPGSITVSVFAEQPGEAYNLSANTSFTIPGFEEGGFTELYETITATNPVALTGGFSGPQFIIDDTELMTARQALQLELRNSLLEKINSERPADFTFFEDAIAITYEALPAVEYGDNLVTIREQALLQIPLFQKDEFASFLAAETVVGYEGNPVRIDNLDSLEFSYVSATTSQNNLANQPSLAFNLNGVPRIVWTFDAEKMKEDLVGMEKTALIGVLGQYPGLDRGEVTVRPFWKSTFPNNVDKFTITEVLSTE